MQVKKKLDLTVEVVPHKTASNGESFAGGSCSSGCNSGNGCGTSCGHSGGSRN